MVSLSNNVYLCMMMVSDISFQSLTFQCAMKRRLSSECGAITNRTMSRIRSVRSFKADLAARRRDNTSVADGLWSRRTMDARLDEDIEAPSWTVTVSVLGISGPGTYVALLRPFSMVHRLRLRGRQKGVYTSSIHEDLCFLLPQDHDFSIHIPISPLVM
ncbi:uncharacterized protein LAESUDRAFT_305093 [Laetiporus sulphureus 93-53]|uniref:Uncharacterized protein n=1 Tax=Laetiporus sulphureus 93-53 TaxID=1314785 RepID=A0A165D8I3_9APHY|nr:uncharacterized protein LAESUDRAFT_305093 [Laetiporus sulphureus 93-53]KZT04333.1 hypothetical protein LAESUDRAFT_305093 [Laetiporus sulphureus 93-53]